LAAKHRQLARQVGESVSSSANSMATFAFDTMMIDQCTTFAFGSRVCIANGSCGFDSYLNNPRVPGMISTGSSNLTGESSNLNEILPPDLAKEIERKLDDNSSPALSQIDLSLNSTQARTFCIQPIFGLRNSSSAYK
jgi:hypothetical protein